MKKYIITSLWAVLTIFSVVNCKKQVEEEPYLKLSEQTLSFPQEGSVKEVKVETNVASWSVAVELSAQSWIKAEKGANTLKVTASENKSAIREGIVKITAGNSIKELKVQQLGAESAIKPDKESIKLDKFAQDFTLVVTANVEYELTLPDWITEKNKEALSDGTGYKHTLSVTRHEGTVPRSFIAKLVSKNTIPRIEKTIIISQSSQYANDNTAAIESDIKLKIARGTASSSHPGEGIEKTFDGDMNTIYHSRWGTGTPLSFPVNIEYFLEKAEDVDYMVYHPRPGGGNGNFGEIEVWVSTESNPTYVKLKDADFKQQGAASRVTFDSTISGAKSFKIVVKSGLNGHASSSEVEFFKRNTGNFDPNSIFTDITCSELKAGITDEQIEAINNPFYKSLATYLKKGEYPTEFRVQEYRAWANPDEIRVKNRMNYSYSNLDNPTGIYVDENEELVVFVGQTHGRDIQVKIMNLDLPNGDGFNQASYHSLFQGVNKFKAGKKGLIYLQYKATNYASAPKIKVHFATGKVNGYYDKTKHTNPNDWTRLITAASYKYFDVIGEKAHLCFETQDFITYTGARGKELIDIYDDLIEKTHIFSGTVGTRAMGNRSYFQVMYHSFMYCTAYRTSYNKTTMSGLCNPTTLKNNIWGPAHEVGHSQQVPPTFLWIGMTEVTVNMNSMNIQTAWGLPTRLETESMANEGGYNNRYEKAYNLGLVPQRPFAEAGGDFSTNAQGEKGMRDVFCNLVPFWQLNLYFSKVKDDPQFYVKLYEELRTIPLKPSVNHGEYQVDFTKSASKIAQTDLTHFFERWGFYKPINVKIRDYSYQDLIVTDAYANKVKGEISAMGLPTITDKIEYICDTNWEIYKNRASVVKGTATRSGNRVTTSGYQNVVAYEVYDASNQLIFVTNKASFDAKKTFAKVYAIAYNGDKTEVTF